MAHFDNFALAVTLAAVVTAAATDLRSRRIPNWLVVSYLAAGVGLNCADKSVNGLWFSLAGLCVAALAVAPFYWMGGLGMGDCKLLAAIGACLGPYQMVFVLFGTAIAGGGIAVLYALRRGALRSSLGGLAALTGWIARHGARTHPEIHLKNSERLAIPYATAIAAGALFSFLQV